jgi:hypothetical protein
MMFDIDSKLIADGIAITGRPLRAVGEVSAKFNVSIPIAGDASRMPPDLRLYTPLGDAIYDWYQQTYGDRLKVDPCPGRTVANLDGDLYVIKIPRIRGSARFILSRQFLPEIKIVDRGPVTCNLLQLIEDMTPAKATQLSDNALKEVNSAFGSALWASYTLEDTQHELMWIAKGDVTTAINNLMDKSERYGESKWASLQAAEKVMKAAIDLGGGEYKRTHGLKDLSQVLSNVGVAFQAEPFVNKIQCAGGIRYGEQTCTRSEALAAHRASLDLINELFKAGAKFESGLGAPLPDTPGSNQF